MTTPSPGNHGARRLVTRLSPERFKRASPRGSGIIPATTLHATAESHNVAIRSQARREIRLVPVSPRSSVQLLADGRGPGSQSISSAPRLFGGVNVGDDHG